MSNVTTSLREISLSAIQPQNREAPRGNYTPTLIVGVGGTGIRTLRYLKSLLIGNPNHQIQLLGIDCDASEMDKYPELPTLTLRDELILLDATVSEGAIVGAKERQNQYLLDYLPDAHGARTNIHGEVRNTMRRQRGAGQRRRVGRVLLEANAEGGAGLLQVFQRKHDRLRGLETRAELTQAGYNFLNHASVYVVSSLAGGTGAGSLMSTLAMIRKVFSQPGDTITVIGCLPGRRLDEKLTDPYIEKPATRANAVALLRELQATRLSRFPNYSFQFGALAHQSANDRSLADSVYLLDHELYDSTPVPSYEDICRTAGNFLYAFVGTGVGAADAAGEVNLTASGGAGSDGVVRCFDSIGLSVLAYPIEKLLEYCGRDAVNRWSKHWLHNAANSSEVRRASEALSVGVSINYSKAFTERLKAMVGITAPGFLADEGERAAVISGASDEELKNAAATSLHNLKQQLPDRIATLDAGIDAAIAGLMATLRKGLLSGVSVSATHAAQLLDHVLEAAKRCRSELVGELAANEDHLADLENRVIPNKALWMDWLPGNVGGNRNKYIEAVNEQMECLLTRGVAPHYVEAVGAIVSEVERVINEFDAALVAISTIATENRLAIESMDRDGTSVDGMTVFAMKPSDFASFVADIPEMPLNDLGLTGVTVPELLAAVVRQSAPAYEAKLSALNLGAELKRRIDQGAGNTDFLLNALRAADNSSQPRLRFRNNLPPITELGPRKYVVGQGVDGSITGQLTPRTAHANVTPVTQFSDPFRILIVETFHNFGAAHWEGFEDAKRFYDVDPWWRHILPSDAIDKLPEFKL